MSTVAEVKALRASVRAVKSAYTSYVTSLVNKFNSGQPIVASDWVNLVTLKYDPLTIAMNELGKKIDELPEITNYVTDNVGNILTSPLGDRITAG